MTPYGYAGKVLRVNLSEAGMVDEEIDIDFIQKSIGGAGFGARYLYQENPVNIEWDDPENRIIIANGPLSNTAIRGSGTVCFTSKGPMTNLAGSSQGNGFIGAFLKSCGYDGIVIQGKADRWSYLVVSEDRAQLRNAEHLLGKDTQETQALIKEELGRQRGVSVYCIGPAAEKRVRFSMIMGDGTHTASKNGLGAVMASKNLKAIVVFRGRFKAKLWNEERLKEIAKELHEKAITYMDGSRHKWGTNGTFSRLLEVGALPVRNYTTNLFPEHERMNGQFVRSHFERIGRHTCFNCGINHNLVFRVTEGPYNGFEGEEPELEAFTGLGSQLGITDAGAVFVLCNTADRLGLDVNESGWVIGWVMECYEKGVLTKGDTDGLDMSWGNVDSVKQILHKIANREGIGDLLAGGVKRASEQVGGEATEFAVCTGKGSTPRGHDHRGRWHEMVDTCFTNTSTLEATFGGTRPHLMGMAPIQAQLSPWEVPVINGITNGYHIFEDCIGACRFNLNYPKIVTDAFNAATNAHLSLDDILEIGKRIVNTLRVFNIRSGLTHEMEAPSVRYGSAPVDGPAMGISAMEHWDLIKTIYYKTMGWDPRTGKPTPETLRDLDLEDLISTLDD